MKFGAFDIEHPIVLAPMEEVSDRPFRLLCKGFGADVVYTEFASSEALIRNVERSHRKLAVTEPERPIGAQLYGSLESSMERAAAVAESMGPDFIDINCGCWVRKIAMRGDGAGLLRDLHKFEAVVRSVIRATRLPVTVKTRLGWDANSIVILDVARMLEQLGVHALTVHCRTRAQGYTGQADWSWIERIRAVTALPLIGNGDVKCAEDARRLFDMGCDGVMIGRAAIGNPWVFAQVKHALVTGECLAEPTPRERVEICLKHLAESVALRGERRGTLGFRRFYAGYLHGLPWVAKLRAEIMEMTCLAAIEARLRQFLDELASENSHCEP